VLIRISETGVFFWKTTRPGMNRNLITWIITVVSLVLLSLTAVQLYWVRNAISVERANFENKVNEAVSNVIYRLEKLETYGDLQETIMSQSKVQAFLQSMDSVNKMLYDDLRAIQRPEDIEKLIRKSFMAKEVLNEMIAGDGAFDIEKTLNKNLLDSLLNLELKIKEVFAATAAISSGSKRPFKFLVTNCPKSWGDPAFDLDPEIRIFLFPVYLIASVPPF